MPAALVLNAEAHRKRKGHWQRRGFPHAGFAVKANLGVRQGEFDGVGDQFVQHLEKCGPHRPAPGAGGASMRNAMCIWLAAVWANVRRPAQTGPRPPPAAGWSGSLPFSHAVEIQNGR